MIGSGSGFMPILRLWFAPEQMRDEGRTPDYRFSLANERTFLAWIRTALALVVGGFAVGLFLSDLWAPARIGMALALLAAGALVALWAVHHWVRCERAVRRGEELPVSRFPVLLSLVVGVVALVMLTVVLSGWAKGDEGPRARYPRPETTVPGSPARKAQG